MKEIKFRAWHNGEILYHQPAMSVHSFAIMPDGKVFYKDEPGYVNGKNRDSVIMQFTGFQDKKGVEIYEGDIFRVEEDGAEDGTDMIYYLVIVWIKEWGMFGTLRVGDEYPKYLIEGAKALDEPMFWTYTLEDTSDRRFYLAGNIYENPELLNSTELKSSYQHPKL